MRLRGALPFMRGLKPLKSDGKRSVMRFFYVRFMREGSIRKDDHTYLIRGFQPPAPDGFGRTIETEDNTPDGFCVQRGGAGVQRAFHFIERFNILDFKLHRFFTCEPHNKQDKAVFGHIENGTFALNAYAVCVSLRQLAKIGALEIFSAIKTAD